jgi:AraC-like DNA-binding protein
VGFRLDTTDQAELDSFSDLPSHLMVANVTQIAEYFRQLHRLWNAREPGYTMACRGLILLLMQQYVVAAQRSRRRIPNAARIQSVITRMHQSVGVVLSVSELAAMARLSESRFRTLFHAMTGCSVTRYQNRLRISAAQDLLASGHYGVTAVSRELGFRDVYYFSRLFKRMTGVCPSQWPNR